LRKTINITMTHCLAHQKDKIINTVDRYDTL